MVILTSVWFHPSCKEQRFFVFSKLFTKKCFYRIKANKMIVYQAQNDEISLNNTSNARAENRFNTKIWINRFAIISFFILLVILIGFIIETYILSRQISDLDKKMSSIAKLHINVDRIQNQSWIPSDSTTKCANCKLCMIDTIRI